MKRCRVYCNSENRSMYEFNRKITMSVLVAAGLIHNPLKPDSCVYEFRKVC